jgi:thioredoxin reductase (NADPH)
MNNNFYQTIIIGSGPAGLTAAIYSSRARIKTLIIGGVQTGGQLMITTDVENFPGFPDGIMGPVLMMNMRKQAQKFGAEILDKDVTAVDFSSNIKKIYVDDNVYTAQTVIVATGASAIWLGFPNEQRLMGKGVSGCATCDGAFFREKVIGVVGGGDTAMEEAIFLTRFASKVILIHRRDQFRASKIMLEKARNNEKIEFMINTEVVDVYGEGKVESVKLRDVITKEERDMSLDGLFIAIGHKPNTGFLNGIVNIDENGYIMTAGDEEILTSIPGIFVAGDVHDHKYRQAITAAGAGCKAALEVERYLELNNTQNSW